MPSPAKPTETATPSLAIERRWYMRWLLRALAAVSLCLGILGIFVPGLPTTVFILMAGWAAMRSSPRLHHWLWKHRLFGPMLQNWQSGGFVSRRSKHSAAWMMAVCAAVLWLTPTPVWVRCAACTCMVVVLLWLWRRPEPQ